MGDIEDEVFESVSVLANKMPRGIFRNPNHDQINDHAFPKRMKNSGDNGNRTTSFTKPFKKVNLLGVLKLILISLIFEQLKYSCDKISDDLETVSLKRLWTVLSWQQDEGRRIKYDDELRSFKEELYKLIWYKDDNRWV